MSEKMLVTQALDERDLLVKKITDKIAKASFVDTIKPNEDKVYAKRIDKAEYAKEAEASYKPLDKDLFEQVWSKAMDMIYSFEAGFKLSWGVDERTVIQKMEDGLNVEGKSIPKNKEEIPFMMAFMEQSRKNLICMRNYGRKY